MTELDDDTRAEIEHLKKQGEHAAAASALWAVGFPKEAALIFEEIFEHEKALAAFEDAEEVVGAMRVALLLSDQKAVDRVVTRALQAGKAEALIGALKKGNRLIEVGRIHHVNGDMQAAADAFEEGGSLLDAAKAREAMGDHRAAGILYERYLEKDTHEAEASFRLGRILCRFSRNDDGIALLQQAMRSDQSAERLAQCAPHLVLGFERLGYETAASTFLEKWRKVDASDDVPLSLDAFLGSPYAQSWSMREDAPPSDVSPKPETGGGLDAFFGNAAQEQDDSTETSVPEASADTHHGNADSDDGRDDELEEEALLAGRYLLGEPLGGGGVGQVFRAFDVFMERPVALKIFGKQALASEAIVAYAREARAAASMGHPAITPLVELNLAHGFQATDLVRGDVVEDRLQEGGDGHWLRPMIFSLLELLTSCHRAGLIHGALKPTNLFLIAGGLRVVDFGAHHLLSLRSTETGGLSSSWPYLAPEQLFGAPANVQTDLYAIAAMLYRAFTGHAPFANAQADRRAPPVAAVSLNADLDDEWNAFLIKALCPQAADRFQDASAFMEALPDFQDLPLPKATLPRGTSVPSPVLFDEDGRYQKGALVNRSGDDVRVYEGEDTALQRQVWLVESSVDKELESLVACAKVGSGVQPVYDVQQMGNRVIVARDSSKKRRSDVELRQVPQALSQDFMQLARSIQKLHDDGYAFGGFTYKRAVGPIGPRMRLCPAPLPVVLEDATQAKDWASFGSVLLAAFTSASFDTPEMKNNDDTTPLSRDDVKEKQEHFVFLLVQQGLLERSDSDALRSLLIENASWPSFLDEVSKRLVQRAPVRVIAKLVASVVPSSA